MKIAVLYPHGIMIKYYYIPGNRCDCFLFQSCRTTIPDIMGNKLPQVRRYICNSGGVCMLEQIPAPWSSRISWHTLCIAPPYSIDLWQLPYQSTLGRLNVIMNAKYMSNIQYLNEVSHCWSVECCNAYKQPMVKLKPHNINVAAKYQHNALSEIYLG